MSGRGIWLALGGNLGDRAANLRAGLDGLVAGGVEIEAVSALWDTTPVAAAPGAVAQPRYANAAAAGRCALTAHELLVLCKRIEASAGRDLGAPTNSARPLDIDILLLEGELLSAPDLQVPHARMHERDFVLVPLAEIAPQLVHPVQERTISELLAELDRPEIVPMEPAGWWRPQPD